MKHVTKLHGAVPLITAVCASMILASCGGGGGSGQGEENVDAQTATTSTEPAPVVTAEEEVAQAPSQPDMAPAPTSEPTKAPTPARTQTPTQTQTPTSTPTSAEPKPAVTAEEDKEEVAQAPVQNAGLSAATTCGLPNFQAEVLRLVNEMRSQARYCGNTLHQPAGALGWNSKLFAAAAGHATDMANKNYFSHTSLDGRTASQRVTEAGYTWRTTGENIAAGQRTIADVMQGWGDSPGHCANIMNPNFTEVAVSCAASDNSTYKQYWAMSLGSPR